MINIHLGMPRVGFRNLDFVQNNFRFHTPATALIPTAFYREHLRSTVNSRNGNSLLEILETKASLRPWLNFESLGLSQHALLGDPGQLILSARARKKAASRVRKLRAIFDDQLIRFHLMVTEPAEYLYRALSTEAEKIVLRFEAFSWAALIDEIGLVDANNSVVIWNCERGTDIMCEFLRDITGQPELRTDGISQKSLGYRFPDPIIVRQQFSRRIASKLDDYYNAFQTDLDVIKRIHGATVVGESK